MAKSDYINNKQFEIKILEYKNLVKNKIKYEVLFEDLLFSTKYHKKVQELESETIQNKENDKALKELKELLTKFFLELAQNILKFKKFNLVDPDDAVQEFILICFEKLDRFEPGKGKAFNYLTTCILNHYRQLYRSAKNYMEFKNKLMQVFATLETSNRKKNHGKKYDKTS